MNNLENISAAINAFRQGDLKENALKFFNTLGYQSERTLNLSLTAFFSTLDKGKALVESWKSNAILFQLTSENLEGIQSLITAVDNTIIQSYLFVAIELNQNLNKKEIIQITRELNKHSLQPILVLFVESSQLTLSIIHRRLNKQNEQQDVLEKVTLLKDIRISNPHRAHLEILNDLTLSNLTPNPHNFVELHQRWQRVLDTKELNKKFYKEVSQWYFWAIKQVNFPNPENIESNQYHAQNLIRLLTRLLFVWFVKEKQLIPDQLFEEKHLNTFLESDDHSRYYKAILQNLFFATLNQIQGKRQFRKDKQQMNVTNLMRYERYFNKPEEFLTLVESIVPFMNGGLFECLDKPHPDKKGKQGGDVIVYYDGFSDREDNVLKVPDFIFFGEHKNIDLSNELGTKHKSVQIRGLIDIFKQYKFTVAENTPLEEDVALDPELLGQVFENLLASYNPETGTTARKQTGSFYTPREIVDYMVDESLIAYLNSNLQGFENLAGLRTLLNYSTEENLFNSEETLQLIEAIDQCKILDPACGSGAFPMGVLHKLVHCLHILDPQNKQWKERQLEKAHYIDDDKIREQLTNDIEEAFNNNELDYGRKLYLIENGIYGVDIQTIAIQISKLRFFISLMVDQQIDPKKDNFGVRPLPNLETKFVAANTLIGIEKPKSQSSLLSNKEVEQLEQKLKDIRHRIFSAKTPKLKRELREQDKILREQIGELLEKHGLEHQTAVQLAQWNPYDQNMSSPFFDPEWMFGVSNGFDIVIGNPPYGANFTKEEKIYLQKQYPAIKGQPESYEYFIYLATDKFISKGGTLSFINPTNFIESKRSEKLREFILSTGHIKTICNFRFNVWSNNAAETLILNFIKGKNLNKLTEVFHPKNLDEFLAKREAHLVDQKNWLGKFASRFLIRSTNEFVKKIENKSVKLGEICEVSQGIIVYKTREESAKNPYISNIFVTEWKKLLDGKSKIEAYNIQWGGSYLNYGQWLWCAREEKFFNQPKILFVRLRNKSLNKKLIGSYDEKNFYNRDNFNNIIQKDKAYNLKYVLSLFNSTLLNYWYKSHFDNVNVNPEQVRQIPIKKIPASEQQPFIELVDKILLDKKAGRDTKELEEKIDQLVYKLYELTEEEIKIVEGK